MGAIKFVSVVARAKIGKFHRTTTPREVPLELGGSDIVEWVFERCSVIRKGGGVNG